MRSAESWILTYAFNAIWIAVVIAAVAAALARALEHAAAAQRHLLWVTALVLSTALPLVALVVLPSAAPASPAADAGITASGSALNSFFHTIGRTNDPLPLAGILMHVLLTLYLGFVALRVVSLVRGWLTIRRIGAGSALLRYADVAGPFTAGARRPVIVLPHWLRSASMQERHAAIAHEIAHIRRHDFLFHCLFEILAIPVAFHPAVVWIRSRAAQTRELACDDIAATSAESRSAYARSLLNIAGGIIATSQNAPHFAVALFDSDSLEKRIRNLLNAEPRIGRTAARWLLAAAIAVLGTTSTIAATMSVRVAAGDDVKRFAGDWTGELHGHRFFSMHLENAGGRLTGKIARFSIEADGNGELTEAREKEGFTPIVDAHAEGSVLHIVGEDRATTSDGQADRIDLDLVLTGPDRGEIRIPGTSLKPWPVRRQ